ncbi:MAG: hypothetical protein V3V84_07760 [Candidatus Bathyarchaeia archaeon]
MKKHNFDQSEVLILGDNNITWSKFQKICMVLGFNVRLTGGVVLTHEINTDEDDFNCILEMIKDGDRAW